MRVTGSLVTHLSPPWERYPAGFTEPGLRADMGHWAGRVCFSQFPSAVMMRVRMRTRRMRKRKEKKRRKRRRKMKRKRKKKMRKKKSHSRGGKERSQPHHQGIFWTLIVG